MSDQAGLGSLVEEIRQASDSIADAKNARRLEQIEPIALASFFGPRSHAAARLRLRHGQCWPRHAAHSGLARPSVDPAHDALHATERGAVQGFLEVENKQQLHGGFGRIRWIRIRKLRGCPLGAHPAP
jgi:hypothetical protein